MPHGQSLEQQQTRCRTHDEASLQCLFKILHLPCSTACTCQPAALQPKVMVWLEDFAWQVAVECCRQACVVCNYCGGSLSIIHESDCWSLACNTHGAWRGPELSFCLVCTTSAAGSQQGATSCVCPAKNGRYFICQPSCSVDVQTG